MNFIRANLRKIHRSSLTVFCELLRPKLHAKHSPNIGKLSRELDKSFPYTKLGINTTSPSSFLRILGFCVNLSCRTILTRFKDHVRRHQNFFMIQAPSQADRSQKDFLGLDVVRQNNGKDKTIIATQICLEHLVTGAFAVGVLIYLANLNNLGDLLKFSLRLENAIRDCNGLVLIDTGQKEN